MDNKIRIGILGYGNLGRGVELAAKQNKDMEIAAFFTRREPGSLKTLSPDVPVYSVVSSSFWLATSEKYAIVVPIIMTTSVSNRTIV